MVMATNDKAMQTITTIRRPSQSAIAPHPKAPTIALYMVSSLSHRSYIANLRGYWRALKGGLPLCIDDIARTSILSSELMSEIFPELWYADDVSRCLVLKTDKQDYSDHVDAPSACERVLAKRRKLAHFMVFLVRKMTESGSLRCVFLGRKCFRSPPH
jgi:hypothetical protein